MKKEGTPAQKRAWAKCRNNPTKKQLAARRRFAAMSRANAKARRSTVRSVSNRSHKQPGKSRKGKKNQAVKAPAKKRAAQSRTNKAVKRPAKKRGAQSQSNAKIRETVRQMLRDWKRATPTQRKQATKKASHAASRKAKKPLGVKHNKAVDEVFKTFVGRDSHSISDTDFPNGSPTNLARLGLLVKLISETETFKFEESERVYLAADSRGNLYIGGRQQPVEPNTNFGHLLSISYVCRKMHIEPGQIVQYDHKFGDEGGKRPRLRSDAEGRFLISGGAYTITSEGIAD